MNPRVFALGLGFLAFAGVVLFGALAGPDRMPLHWGLSGDPDRVGSRARWVVETSAVGLFLLATVLFLLWLLRRVPMSMANIPHRDYWSRPENEARARRLMADDTADVMGDVVLFIVVLELIVVIRARSGDVSLPLALFLVTLGLLLVSVGLRLWKMRGRYDPDRDRP